MPENPRDEETVNRATGTTTVERERILAAVGWQDDPRRRRVLRELLQGEQQRIYLYCYSGSRNRAAALDGQRSGIFTPCLPPPASRPAAAGHDRGSR